ncbi:EAL domain-containing protein [Pseudoalteromonas rubra]|uniref:sensor domain-containing protein n=1 Tax=Pseudoalteromonas rubra TaxID=43658 RepID=UPI002DBD32FF|nr:EAL domain-containing protein [Pseudoalteromonas rubra]MEC4088226.1 EAL domain-containing protein [Pseudoalteromonas rubra]
MKTSALQYFVSLCLSVVGCQASAAPHSTSVLASSAGGATSPMILALVVGGLMAAMAGTVIWWLNRRSDQSRHNGHDEAHHFYLEAFQANSGFEFVFSSDASLICMSDGLTTALAKSHKALFAYNLHELLEPDSWARLAAWLEEPKPGQVIKMTLVSAHSERVTGLFELQSSEHRNLHLARYLHLSPHLGQADTDSELLAVTLSSIGDGVICCDIDSRVIFMNPVAEAVLALLTEEVKGKPITEVMPLYHEGSEGPIEDQMAVCMRSQQTVSLPDSTCFRNHLGLEFAIDDSCSPVYNNSGKVIGAVMIFQDVTESRALKRKMNHLAHHDALTGLPNRLLLQDRLIQACKRALRNRHQFAVVFMDLNKFKKINDSLGHDFGDLLLKQIAQRLTGSVRACDTVSRMGGDEFVLLLDAIEDKRHVRSVIKKVLDGVCGQYEIKGVEVQAALSAGVALYPDDGDNAELLMKRADSAMYRAKRSGKGGMQFYCSKLDDEAEQNQALEQAILDALAADKFVPHFQPVVCASDGRLVQVEMLARWHKEGTLVEANRFINEVSEVGCLMALQSKLWEQAFKHFASWQATIPELRLSINVSVKTLQQDEALSELNRCLSAHQLQPRQIEIEIMEQQLALLGTEASKVISHWQQAGFSIAIDDFDASHTSIGQLHELKIDALKLDPGLLSRLVDEESQSLIKSVLVMAKNINVTCCAEGVESAEQVRVLSEMGCTLMQGYHVDRPVSAEQLTDYLAKLNVH